MVTTYFDNVNDYFPIFSRSNVEEKIRLYNNTADDLQDPALSLCFNNMILLALLATSRARLAEEIPVSMELSLLRTFWDNAMGAFKSPLYPTLVNVQALLSLCLVCQSMCLVKMARSCLQLAQTVCKLMDMQADPLQKQQEPVVDEERIDVSWCMSILENSISFPSPGQSFYTLQIPLPVEQPESPAKSHFIANIRLAQIRENMRVTLFGSSTNGPLGTATQTLAFGYLDELQQIQASLGVDVSLANLAFHELVTSDLNSAESLADAQNAVRILITMGSKTIDEVKSHAILPRLFVTDSLVALSALASGVIRDPSRLEDAELLRSIYHLLQRMNKVCAESTFSSALEAILGAVLDFVTAVGRPATSMGVCGWI
ncbi:C6 zinc finger domain protein [Penicillium odoratum]|uniref:C6 zinc finger domain protein n=1 Tax=Penicillium odoratum TaxID=1167516 RepID=UPI002547C8BE|nr:C6 zinc finger domain protein [Penicillium odoratum]KAJ5746806.1 C6 zinc finger domain protein [Penicillium odoratum]